MKKIHFRRYGSLLTRCGRKQNEDVRIALETFDVTCKVCSKNLRQYCKTHTWIQIDETKDSIIYECSICKAKGDEPKFKSSLNRKIL